MVLLKHVVLIMLKTWTTLDRKGLTRNQQQIWHTREEIYGLSGLEKINSIAILEMKLLAEDLCEGWKIEYFPKVQDQLIQKRGNISIRCLV